MVDGGSSEAVKALLCALRFLVGMVIARGPRR